MDVCVSVISARRRLDGTCGKHLPLPIRVEVRDGLLHLARLKLKQVRKPLQVLRCNALLILTQRGGNLKDLGDDSLSALRMVWTGEAICM